MSSFRRFRAEDGITIALIPKCGLTSIMSSTPGGEDLDKPLNGRVLVFIRHPEERLISAYRFFKDQDSCAFDTRSWPHFVDYALSTFDPHWLPQVEFIRPGFEVYKLSEIDKYWPFATEIKKENESNYHEVSNYGKEKIREHYSKDLDLWHSL